ncbi:ankyrin [Aspergillus japonicus CBS 114.51]|uniref:Ankyrin n=1 Tax=Aspergillus japonicus CBS 114.51 TaxID=1448312 RepID=A0A8T8WU01_ASPJA|nr:ankyrin [Aspergillus japonicus CBS 114.51]RAH78952.1 ankyrin [Aspergillus japonicus CBS 114.51]
MIPDYDTYVKAFHSACRAGDLPKVQETLGCRRRLKIADLSEALEIATHRAHADIVDALFAAGARVSKMAINCLPGNPNIQQDPRIIRQFLDHGLDPNASYSNGIPIQVRNPACARELLLRGADPNRADRRGVTPLTRVVDSEREPDASRIEMLLAHEAKLYPGLLYNAAAPRVPQGEFMTRLLLEKGLDPDAPSIDWGTPLHLAIYSGKPNIVKLSLDAGADPTGKTAHPEYSARSPLQIAGSLPSSELRQAILDLLQSRGIDIDEDGHEGAK